MPLEVRDLAYDLPSGQNLLVGVNLIAQEGQTIAITGPSGTGKSTLLNIIGGLIQPLAGSIQYRRSPELESDVRPLNIFSWILQSNLVLSGRTALDNVSIPLLGKGLSASQAGRSAEIALSKLGMSGFAHQKVGRLSGGEVQRITIARTLASGNPVILADEPSGQLDSYNTGVVIQALRAVADEGHIVLVVTHDESVASACDKSYRLFEGGLRLDAAHG